MPPLQPVQIGMNSVLVLIVLLLAVPLQLFLSHYINSIYTNTAAISEDADSAITGGSSRPEIGGLESPKGIQFVRRDALDRLSVHLTGMVDYIQGTIQHYSKWNNWRELFVIPYRKEHRYKKKKSGSPGFIIERTVTVDKLKNIKTADPELTPSASSKSQKKSSPAEHSNSNLLPSSKDSSKENKLPELTDKMNREEYLYKEVYFAHSKTPRTKRPVHVKLRVGEVVKHKEQGYYGVIVGWDERAMAPEKWLQKYYTNRPHLKDEPNYLVLVDSHYDASDTPYHYIPQEHLALVQANVQIQAVALSQYFEGYSKHRYIPKPWLKQVYPED